MALVWPFCTDKIKVGANTIGLTRTVGRTNEPTLNDLT